MEMEYLSCSDGGDDEDEDEDERETEILLERAASRVHSYLEGSSWLPGPGSLGCMAYNPMAGRDAGEWPAMEEVGLLAHGRNHATSPPCGGWWWLVS